MLRGLQFMENSIVCQIEFLFDIGISLKEICLQNYFIMFYSY